jgi:hypothetical protein
MHGEDDLEIEYSPLCEEITRDGLTGPRPDLSAEDR